MHDSVQEFVAWCVERDALTNASVLEVGSANVNGSNRAHFNGGYIGVDVEDGEGVDLVYDGETLPFGDDAFRVVISTECFEHAKRFWRTGEEMVRVLQPGGTLICTARGNGFPDHNPPDRWRFMHGALGEFFMDLGLRVEERFDPQVPGIFIVATAS